MDLVKPSKKITGVVSFFLTKGRLTLIKLKKEFINLQVLIYDVVEKHSNLEKKYEKVISKKKNSNLKCRKCGDKFEM